MKKTSKLLAVIMLVMSLALVFFCSCDTASGDMNATAGASASAKATASATAKATATAKPTPTPEPTPTVNRLNYTIEFDVSITDRNVGFALAGMDEYNYIMAQFSIAEYNDGHVYYRPHQWVDGQWEVLDEVAIENEVVPADYNNSFHVKLVMDNHELTAFVNGTEITTVEVEDGTYDMFGFRTAVDTTESGVFDNIVITDAEGNVVLSEDFEGDTTYFDEYLDGWNVSVEDGKLVVGGSVEVLLVDPPALTASK